MIDLNPIIERLSNASKGPWHVASLQYGWSGVFTEDNMSICDCDYRNDDIARMHGKDIELLALNNADFIAHARADIETLVVEINRLRNG